MEIPVVPKTKYHTIFGFGNNNTQIYDDGNTHIHARGSGNGI